MTSEEVGDRRSDASRESRSVVFRLIHSKVLYWVGISLYVLLAFGDFFHRLARSRAEKSWTSKPLLKGVGIVVVLFLLWVVTVRVRNVAVRRRRAKNDSSLESSPPIDPA